MKRPVRTVLLAALALCVGCSLESTEQADLSTESTGALLVAHRGASAYAPEHTMAAYQLALEQGADLALDGPQSAYAGTDENTDAGLVA